MTDIDTLDTRSVRITFVNGERRSYAFAPVSDDTATLAARFNEFMSQGYIVLEKSDSYVVIPTSSILSMEVAPKPAQTLPNSVKFCTNTVNSQA